MKKNNKGFTLTELVAVLALMTIIMLVAFPNFTNLTKSAQDSYDNSTRIIIRSAAQMYVNNNIEYVDDYLSTNDKLCIPVGKLIAYEYLDSDLKNSKGEQINNRKCINVTKTVQNGKIKYEYDLSNNDLIDESKDYLPPVIILKEKTSTECKTVMRVSSIEDFNNKCRVYSKDDKDSEKDLTNPEKTIVNNKVFLEYNDVDSSSNKAIPLKIQLIIE